MAHGLMNGTQELANRGMMMSKRTTCMTMTASTETLPRMTTRSSATGRTSTETITPDILAINPIPTVDPLGPMEQPETLTTGKVLPKDKQP